MEDRLLEQLLSFLVLTYFSLINNDFRALIFHLKMGEEWK